MTKTPEELTEDWKAKKLKTGWYYVVLSNGFIDLARLSKYGRFYHLSYSLEVKKPISIVPTYDEYKAMQEKLTEFKCAITSYIGKPINYDIACETVNKLLDDKEKLKKELAEHRIDKAKLEDHIVDLTEKVEKLRLDEAKFEEENNKLRGLLKGCKLSTFKIYDRLRFSDENKITPADLINAVDEIKPMLWGILNSINAALGKSEE